MTNGLDEGEALFDETAFEKKSWKQKKVAQHHQVTIKPLNYENPL